jgi:hypothetical protein
MDGLMVGFSPCWQTIVCITGYLSKQRHLDSPAAYPLCRHSRCEGREDPGWKDPIRPAKRGSGYYLNSIRGASIKSREPEREQPHFCLHK